jgi:hypothetical protein
MPHTCHRLEMNMVLVMNMGDSPPQDRPSGRQYGWIHVFQCGLRLPRSGFLFQMFLHVMNLGKDGQNSKINLRKGETINIQLVRS